MPGARDIAPSDKRYSLQPHGADILEEEKQIINHTCITEQS